MQRPSVFMLTMIALLLSIGCAHQPTTPEPQPPRELTALEKAVVQADNDFGLQLFRQIVQDERDENVFISPLSASMALGMTLNGAAGSTKDAMEKTLGVAGMSTEAINESYKNLLGILTSMDPAVQLRIANSVWYRQEMAFEAEFIDRLKTYFAALVQGVNFNLPDQAAVMINAWVDRNTNGKIEQIISADDIDAATVMFLINATYFKGAWTQRFDPQATRKADFYLQDGSTISCDMMQLQGNLAYFETDLFQAVDLAYGNEYFSMLVLLPKEQIPVQRIISTLDAETLATWLGNFSTQEVALALPKFRLEYKKELKKALAALGMGIAFTDRADFTRMHKQGGLFIEQVRHKTFVEVNEEGTEAAAVTSVEIGRTSMPSYVIMNVNRPFVFAIRDRHSGVVLFIGRILDPTG